MITPLAHLMQSRQVPNTSRHWLPIQSVCVYVCVCVFVCLCVCVCVCVCVCACLYIRPFTVKTSSVWISWNTSKQINDVMLKMFLSSAKFLHRYLRMKLQTFLTNHFILFTHQKRTKPQLSQCVSRFQNIRPSSTITRHYPRSAFLWRQALTRGVAI